jgi:hypothetical protein
MTYNQLREKLPLKAMIALDEELEGALSRGRMEGALLVFDIVILFYGLNFLATL